MAVSLYRQGTTHTIRGTLCEMDTFHPDDVHVQLQNGWFKSPKDAYGLQFEEQKETEEVKTEEVLNFEDMSNKDIRFTAQEAGIESWETARIETLKTELVNGYMESQR